MGLGVILAKKMPAPGKGGAGYEDDVDAPAGDEMDVEAEEEADEGTEAAGESAMEDLMSAMAAKKPKEAYRFLKEIIHGCMDEYGKGE